MIAPVSRRRFEDPLPFRNALFGAWEASVDGAGPFLSVREPDGTWKPLFNVAGLKGPEVFLEAHCQPVKFIPQPAELSVEFKTVNRRLFEEIVRSFQIPRSYLE